MVYFDLETSYGFSKSNMYQCQTVRAAWFTKRVNEIYKGYLIPVNSKMGFHVIQKYRL